MANYWQDFEKIYCKLADITDKGRWGVWQVLKTFTIYHGTDVEAARKIIVEGFKTKPSKEHWLGNGIYFYFDRSLAEWWTTRPTNKFGTSIQHPALVKCGISVEEERVLDMRKLKNYLQFVDKYRKEFWPYVINGRITVTEKDAKFFDEKQLRCAFCDYLFNRYELDAIVGTFDLQGQPYLPEPNTYGEYFDTFNLRYIETQFCVKNKEIITKTEVEEIMEG